MLGNFSSGTTARGEALLGLGIGNLLPVLVMNSFTLRVLIAGSCGFEGATNLACRAILFVDTLCPILGIMGDKNVRSKLFGNNASSWCVFATISYCTAYTLSFVYMSLLSLDRLFQVWKPFLYAVNVTERRAKLVILVVTLIVLGHSSGIAATWRHNTMITDYCANDIQGSRKAEWTILTYSLMILGLMAIEASNIITLAVACKKVSEERRLQPAITANVDSNGSKKAEPKWRDNRRMKSVRTVLIIVVAMTLATIPQLVVIALEDICNKSLPFAFAFMAELTICCNSWWKGFIFMLTNRQFRLAARSEMRRILKFFSCS